MHGTINFEVYMVSLVYVCVMCGCRRMLRTTLKQMIWMTTFGHNFIGGKLCINRA